MGVMGAMGLMGQRIQESEAELLPLRERKRRQDG